MPKLLPIHLDSITINVFFLGFNFKIREPFFHDHRTAQEKAEVLKHLTGHKMVIRAFNERYVSVHQDLNGRLIADSSKPTAQAIFELFRLPDDKIALRAWNGRFVSATLPPHGVGELLANRPTISGWEAFTYSYLADGKVSLQAFDDRYVTANLHPHGSGELIADRESVSGWEAFIIDAIE